MTDFPAVSTTPLFISSLTMFCGAEGARSGGSTGSSLASISWGTANRALYIPLLLPWPYLVQRVFWGNGSVTGNMDFGIYSNDGTKIYSTGSTGQVGASAVQYVSPTAFTLSAGRYFMAIVNDGTTNRGWGVAGTINNLRLAGWLQQATALPLPATATFAADASTLMPLCGITRTASGF